MKRFLGLVAVVFMAAGMSFGQAISVNGGSIQGVITDPTGAIVPNASVTITGQDTGSVKVVTTDSAGFYSDGPLNPGNYTVTVVAPGFQKLTVKTVVRTGTATSGNFKLTLGQSTETVEVNAGELQVNTEQAGVNDVITKEQIESLPVNGRNFLDLAQVEPGVILQSGESFDPTKAGYSAISVSGVSGRTTRILLDGQDITDETVGTTIFNVSQGAINEFQLNRSTQDVSGDVTSTGQVLVSTNSGTNQFHGMAYYNFQDARAGFARVTNGLQVPFQRNQFGGSVGGPILKDKLFFFVNAERIKQDSAAASPVGPLFASIFAAHPEIPSPYRETYSTGRIDYNGPWGGHYYFRGNYNVNAVASNFGDGYWLYANRDNTPGFAGGADFQHGHFTHSFRGSYEKFHNLISDQTTGNNTIYNGIPGLAFYLSAQGLFSGPNYLAPQGTFQTDKQFRYDGSWLHGAHNVRYGYALNRILGGGYAAFFGLSPRVQLTAATQFKGGPGVAGCGGVIGAAACPSDPLNGYFPRNTYLGNGQGTFTEHPAFGLPGGGVYDWRSGAYLEDSWKISPTFTLIGGLRWSVDTGRANQDITNPQCSDVDPSVAPCSGSSWLFSQWNPSLGGAHVHQPYANFGPQVGFTYSPGGNGKTVLRAAVGIFYEGDVFNNTTNARSSLIKQGAFFDDRLICNGTYSIQNFPGQGTTPVTSVDGLTIQQVCSMPLVNAAPHLIHLQQEYQAATKANAISSNAGYVANTLDVSGVYGTPYRTPYSEQWNLGVQRELMKGAILTVDYVHNSTLKIGQQVDQNHIGAARFLQTTAAQNAIAATVAAYPSCPGGYSSASIDCAIQHGAQLNDFAGNGLDSGNVYLGGSPASLAGLTANTGAAFPGANAALGSGSFILPIGRSGYDALQVVYKQVTAHPMPGVESANVQVSYNLSQIVSSSNNTTSDQFFSGLSYDNDNPNAYMGRAGLDHTNQLSFGGSFTLKYGPQIGMIGHFYSAAATTLLLDTTNGSGSSAGDIFVSDVTGDGTAGDVAPGTLPGDYMHRVNGRNLGKFINNYNSTLAGTLTPAGQALVNAKLFTAAQLSAIGAVQQPMATLPQATGLNNAAFRSMDVNLSYPIRLNKLREGMNIQPGVAFYNVFNMSNFTTFSPTLLNVNGAGGAENDNAGYVSGINSYTVLNGNRRQRGSGTFDQGGPRSTEFSLKFNF
jgi:Carboxypeptidase regulatory-like domain